MPSTLPDFSQFINWNSTEKPRYKPSFTYLTVGEIKERFREEYDKQVQEHAKSRNSKTK